MNLKNPNTLSFIILLLILLVALSAAYLIHSEQPEGTIFQVEGSDFTFPYELSKPRERIDLPNKLREISGLTWTDSGALLTIQDEKGIIFDYDLHKKKIGREVKFEKDRDFEGIAAYGKQVFVLESDGDIYRVDSLAGEKVKSKKYETRLSHRDNTEGLAYDPVDNRLLVALKEAKQKESGAGEGLKRLIYSFNLRDHRLSEHPVYFLDQLELGRLIFKKEKSFQFKPSGIAVDPKSGYIYVIASVGKILIVIDRTGQLKYAERLDPKLLTQPEGITFAPDGRLFLSSEGRGGRGRLLVFNRKK